MIPRLALVAVGKVVGFPSRIRLWTFDAACRKPREVQAKLLREILHLQADTDFGRDHKFRQIASLDDFRNQLPIAPYEHFEPYLSKCRAGKTDALVTGGRILMFALTSGTTSSRKYIPITPRYLKDFQRGWNRWGLRTLLDHQNISCAPMLQIVGDADEMRTEAGIPCGSLSGLTAMAQKRFMRVLYTYPVAAKSVHDTGTKYYIALRMSLAKAVGLILTPNPSTLAGLARTLHARTEELLRDLRDGTLSADLDLPKSVRESLRPFLKKKPARAQQLEAIARQSGGLWPRDVWNPRNLLLGTWMGGSVGPYLEQIREYYGPTLVRDLGLVASEGRMSIPLEDGTPSGVLDVTTHVFEFIPEGEIESAKPIVLAAHEVEEGKNYFVVPTTAAGLYRYDLHDLVRVTGFHGRTPKIEFLSKGSHFSSLTGEKLNEYQVIRAMADAASRDGVPLPTYALAPCWTDDKPYYGLFLETGNKFDSNTVDRGLQSLNDEYRAKRESGRLGPVKIEWLRPGTWADWTAKRQKLSGGTVEQYKHPCLIGDVKFADSIRRSD